MRLYCTLNPHECGWPIEFISESLAHLLGKPQTQCLGQRWDHLIDLERDGGATEAISEALHNRRYIARVVSLQTTKDSSPKLFSFFPIVDHKGDIAVFFLIVIGVDGKDSDHQSIATIEAKVRRAAVRCLYDLEAVVYQVSHCLSAHAITNERDGQSTIDSTSEGFTKLTGYLQQEVRRTSWAGLYRSRGGIPSEIDRRRSTISTLTMLNRKDGSVFWAEGFDFPIASSTQTLRIVVDVTSRRSDCFGNYTLGRTIGNGASGVVRIGKSFQSNEIVAIKIVDAAKFRSIAEIELVQDEITALSSVKHENIINLHEVIYDHNLFYFVMDFAAGGSLANYLRSTHRTRLNEADAKDIFRQVISAVSYCHRRRVIHRDLKPENILMDGNGRIQVADFGLSAIAAPCGSLSTVCGTPEFLAPEIISTIEFDGVAADIWSLGVILYELLTGRTPFKGTSRVSLFKAIQCAPIDPLPDDLSLACRDLISRMLIKDPQTRICMEAILTHPWMQSTQENEDDAPSTIETSVHESVKLTIGDWASGMTVYADHCSAGVGDDAISNAIVSGDYSRSPSIVVLRNGNSEADRLSADLEAVRQATGAYTESTNKLKKPKSSKRVVKLFRNNKGHEASS